jgi:PAS domain S-box-containing protein
MTAQIELMISFADLEERNIEKDVDRARNAISNDLTNLGDLANYWAARNDIYAFMTSEDLGFINYNLASDNLTNESLYDMEINLILFMDSYGQMTFSRYLNISGKGEKIPQNLIEQLSLYGFCPGCLDKQSKSSGIILLSDQPMLIVTRPITNSTRTAPSMGRVVLGRYLTREEVSRLSDVTQLNLTIYPINDDHMSADLKQVRPLLSYDSPILIKSFDKDNISGYALLMDIYGNPLLILKVDGFREIYRQGARSVQNFIILFSAAGLLFLILTLLYLDRSVLSRLINLTADVTGISLSPNISARLRVQGKDELTYLAVSINDMLNALERTHAELVKSEKRYKAVVEDQTDLICRYLSDNTITFVNEAFCNFFSVDQEEAIGNKIEEIASDKQIRSSKQLKNKICAEHPVITYESQSGGPWDARWLLWTSRGLFDESKELIEIQSVGKEITELKAAEEALKESEDRYRQLVDLAPVGIVLHSAGRIAYINKAGTRFIGASSPDKILGKPILDFVHPDYRQIVIERVKRATKEAQASPMIEEKFLRLDGRTIDVEVAALAFGPYKGEQAVQVIFRDISERKKAEEARQESEERYRLISENMTDMIHLHTPDPDLRYVYVSPSIKISGYDPQELIGKSPFDIFILPEDAEIVKQSLSRMIESKGRVVSEYRVRIRDGSIAWVETSGNPILDLSGNVVLIICSSRDVSQRKQAEEALRRSQQLTSDIISFLPDAILAIDLDGKVIIWNRAMEILTGVKAEEMLGKGDYEHSLPFYEYRRPILVDMVLKPYEGYEAEYFSFQREGTAVVGEVFISTFGRHGSYLLAKATALCDNNGKIVGAIESIRDMTERRQIEQNLERTRVELHVAAEIQKSFIPKKTPIIPHFEVAAITIPAREVGGDFYDFISLPEGKYGLVIADVAGKSIPAALFMALSRMIIRVSATHQSEASEVLKNANNMIALDATAGMFVTLLYGVLDGEALTLNYANAGHPTPLLFRAENCNYEEEAATGIALGAKEGIAYEQRTITFSPGDMAVFYTDGVTEAMNLEGELFGLVRLNNTISKFCQSSAEDIIGKILKEIADFSGGQEQNDDITLMVLKARKHIEMHSEIMFAASQDEIPKITAYLDKVMSQGYFGKKEILEVQLAVEEACINIIRHGYRGAEGTILVMNDFEDDDLKVTIEDRARRFDPTQFEMPTFVDNVDERPLGGLGIHLLKSLVDESRYEYQEGKNRLTLIKYSRIKNS